METEAEDALPVWETEAADFMPARLDSSKPYPEGFAPGSRRGDYLGGLAWTAGWTRYIGHSVPTRVADVRTLRRAWWTDDRLRAKLVNALGPHTVELLIRWRRDDFDYGACNRLSPWGQSNPGWLEVQDRRARRLIRLWLPPTLNVDRLDAVLAG